MRIGFIARSTLGAMGEAALTNYVRLVQEHHDVFVIQTPGREKIVRAPSTGLRLYDVPAGPVAKRRRAIYDVLRSTRPDIVHMIQSPYCFDDFMTLKPVFPDIKWCLDFRSPHVGPRDAPSLKRFQQMHLHVDGLMTHSLESLRTNIRRRWRVAVEIPPGVDTASIPFAPARDRQDGSTRLRLVYVGSLSRTRKIDALLDMIAQAVKVTPKLHVDFFGAGNAEEELKSHLIQANLIDRVVFQGQVDQATLWQRMNSYDAGIAYVPNEMFGSAPSLKSIEYAALGLPVLASRTPGHVSFRRRHGFAFNFFSNTPGGLATVLQTGIDRSTKTIQTNRKAAEALDWRRIVETRLLPVYQKLLQ